MKQDRNAHDPQHGQLLCRIDDITDGDAIAVDAALDGEMQSLIVLRRGSGVQVWLNVCPHAGRRLDWAPGRFLIKRDILVCAVHGSSFDVADGRCTAGPGRGDCLRAVPVTINADGEVTLRQS